MTNPSHFFLTILLKNYGKKIKARKQKNHFSTTSIYNNNSLMLP